MTRSGDYVTERVRRWRTGSRESQAYVLGVLLIGVALSFVVSWNAYEWMPLTAYFVWLLAGMLLLRFVPLTLLAVVVSTAALGAMWHDGPIEGARFAVIATLLLSVALILFQSSRQRSGLPVTLSELMLSELRDRLQAQGVMPPLPEGWEAQSAMLTSHGVGYAGDFFVADLVDERRLEMVLVDVCGKGVAVGPQALQFAGALGGLLGALPPHELFDAANRFLLRQRSDESFATAVHVVIDLEEGRYTITSAGHPPALRWDTGSEAWVVDNARGTALGILPDPELHHSEGLLPPGGALLFYTDGVIESHSRDLDIGIAWLQEAAREAVVRGFAGAARRIISQVGRGRDDRAVLILSRTGGQRPGVGSPDSNAATG
ncbi:MAG: serine/threonine-protein phosphatase [Actinomycetota bacterium]|nr:serine/threonine-protein phosphatase [Actinomycetota bacterium]